MHNDGVHKMKKKVITIDDIEKKMKEMGAVNITEAEFSASPEYKNIYKYFHEVFELSTDKTGKKRNNRPHKNRSSKVKA